MIRKRTIGTIAAIGGLTAFVMLAGVPNAKADELSDLRANNDLLQQRLDQIAQTGNVGPSRLYSTDAQAMTAAATAGSFPRSFLIPGTDTSIRVGGNITIIGDYVFEGGAQASPWSTTLGANGQVGTLSITANGKTNSLFAMSPRQSQLSIETRTPTPYGEARSYMSFDWAGSTYAAPGGPDPAASSDNLVPRLKYAYGTLGGWLAGQANSNFQDGDANAETLDFGGNVGEPGRVRVTQLRYTIPLTWSWGGALSFSAESPDVEVLTPNGLCGSDAGATNSGAAPSPCASPGGGVAAVDGANVSKPIAPDVTAALYVPQPWGHFDLAGILRPEGLSDGAYYAKDFLGGGGAFSFDVKPGWFTPKDDITFHFVGGTGLGQTLNMSSNAAIETNWAGPTKSATGACTALTSTTAVTTATNTVGGCIAAKLIPSTGGEIGYQHWWSDTLHSTFSYGFNHQYGLSAAYLGAGILNANKNLQTAHANLVWNPVSFVTIGLEYMWGERTVVQGNNAGPGGTSTIPNNQQLQALVGKFDLAF